MLLAVLFTWPAAWTLSSAAVGSVEGDGVKHLWNLWWMRAEFWGGTPGLLTTFVNFPEGMALYPIEPSNGLLAVFSPFGVITTANLLAILHLTLTGLCSGWLGYLVSERRVGGLLAGALVQGSAFSAFTLHVGVGELRQFWWIPLGLACVVKVKQTLETRWFVALGLSLVGATLSCFYHGFFLATGVAVYAICTLRLWPRLLLGYLLCVVLSLAVVIPVIRSFSQSFGGEAEREKADLVTWMRDWRGAQFEEYRQAALDPIDLVRPRREARATLDRQALAYSGGRYVGVLAVVVAVLGFAAAPRRAWPWVAVGVVALILSFGTVLWWNGELWKSSGGRLVLPLAYVNRLLAWFAEPLNFPSRFLSLATVALGVLAALGARWRVVWVLVPLSIIDGLYNELVPWPRASFSLARFEGLAPPEGAMVDLALALKASDPSSATRGSNVVASIDPETRTRSIAAQAELGRPIQGMPVERVDHWATDGLAWVRVLPLIDALTRGNADPAADWRADLWLLRERGFRSVMLSSGSQEDKRVVTSLDAILGPSTRAENGRLWTLPEVQSEAAERERWAAAQHQRVAKAKPAEMGVQFPGPP